MVLPPQHLLSLGRAVLAFAVAGELEAGTRSPWVLPVVVLACASDFLDGRVARSRGDEGLQGRWLDNGADLVFLSVAFGAFADIGLWSSAAALPRGLAYGVDAAPLWGLLLSFGTFALRAAICQLSKRPLAPSAVGRATGVMNYALALVGAAAVFPGVEPGAAALLTPVLIAVAANLAAFVHNVALIVRLPPRWDGGCTG